MSRRSPSPGSSRGSAPSMPWTASTSRRRPGPSSACSAPTARARPRPSASSPRSWRRTRAAPAWQGSTSSPTPPCSADGSALRASTRPSTTTSPGSRTWSWSGGSTARAGELLERFSLMDAADRVAKTYSGGMRRRLDLAAALVARPPVLFLDEPTTGLDPRSRLDLWATIEALVAEGTTVLLTTQYLDEADRLADDIAVIDHGKVIAHGTADELKDRVGGERLEVRVADPSEALEAAWVLGRPGGELPQID